MTSATESRAMAACSRRKSTQAGVQGRAVEQRRQEEDQHDLGVEREGQCRKTSGEASSPPTTSSTGEGMPGASRQQARQADPGPDEQDRRDGGLEAVDAPLGGRGGREEQGVRGARHLQVAGGTTVAAA